MSTIFNLFDTASFTTVELTENVIRKIDYKPDFLGRMGLFEPIYSRSRIVAVVKTERGMSMIPTSELGAPPAEYAPQGADMRNFNTFRLAKGSSIFAHELQGVLGLDNGMQLKELQSEVADRSASIMDDMELTWEHMRLGAVLGTVYDADNSRVLNNAFTDWGVTANTEIDFVLGTTTTDVRKKVRDLKRDVVKKSKGRWTAGSQLVALCGDNFFDKLVTHKQFVETKLNNGRTTEIEDIDGYSMVKWEGIEWWNYRGTDDGSSLAIATDKVKFFPKGVKGAFQVGWAPGEFFPYVNQKGQPTYGMLLKDPSGRDAFRRVEVYSYPLFMCTAPELLNSGTSSN